MTATRGYQWRVGSFSLGLTLIMAGVSIALGWFGGNLAGVFSILRFWPAVLLLLGVEIVIASATTGREHPMIKYDWLGVFAIILIVSAGLLFEAADATGLLEKLEWAARAVTFDSVEIPGTAVAIDEGVFRAVISCDRGAVEIRTIEGGDSIVVFGSGSVTVLSPVEAENWAASFAVSSRREADTLFVTLQSPPVGEALWRSSSEAKWVVLVPSDVALDASAPSQIELIARGLSATATNRGRYAPPRWAPASTRCTSGQTWASS